MNRTKTSNHFYLFDGAPWMVVYICEAVFIIVGNSLTIYIFWGIRKQLKRTSYLLINLAFADLLVGITLSLWISNGIAAMMEVRLSYTVFRVTLIIDVLGLVTSVLSLVVISLERMLAIVRPFRHRMLRMWHYQVAIASTWILSSLNAGVNVNIGVAYSYVTVVTEIGSILTITIAYLTIWISTKRSQFLRKSSRNAEQNKKLAKTLFLVTVLSIATCLPNAITLATRDYLQQLHSFRVQITLVALFANSFINPILYCYKMPAFKKSLKTLLCHCSREQRIFDDNSFGVHSGAGITLKSMRTVADCRLEPQT